MVTIEYDRSDAFFRKAPNAHGICHSKLPFFFAGVVHYILGLFYRAIFDEIRTALADWPRLKAAPRP